MAVVLPVEHPGGREVECAHGARPVCARYTFHKSCCTIADPLLAPLQTRHKPAAGLNPVERSLNCWGARQLLWVSSVTIGMHYKLHRGTLATNLAPCMQLAAQGSGRPQGPSHTTI